MHLHKYPVRSYSCGNVYCYLKWAKHTRKNSETRRHTSLKNKRLTLINSFVNIIPSTLRKPSTAISFVSSHSARALNGFFFQPVPKGCNSWASQLSKRLLDASKHFGWFGGCGYCAVADTVNALQAHKVALWRSNPSVVSDFSERLPNSILGWLFTAQG